MPIPEMQIVKSSHVRAVGHDGTALYVHFQGRNGAVGPIYRYPSAGPEVLAAMLASPSIGRFARQDLRAQHHGEPVDGS